jgi:hypothetical protein
MKFEDLLEIVDREPIFETGLLPTRVDLGRARPPGFCTRRKPPIDSPSGSSTAQNKDRQPKIRIDGPYIDRWREIRIYGPYIDR